MSKARKGTNAMYETNYHKAHTIEEAVKLLAKAEDGKILAGGQTLIPTMKQRLASPTDLIDITRIEGLKGIEAKGNSVIIKAATRHADVAISPMIPVALANLAAGIGDPHVRNMGTLGGSLANNDPAADYPAAILALAATIYTNKRTIIADDFFQGMFTTTLDEDEIITHVVFPLPQKAAYEKFPNPASRYAMAGVFVAQLQDGSVRVAVTGAGADGVFRSKEMETALTENWSVMALDNITMDENLMNADIHGSSAYRAHLVMVMAKRAVSACSLQT